MEELNHFTCGIDITAHEQDAKGCSSVNQELQRCVKGLSAKQNRPKPSISFTGQVSA
jgi:hypothetical protein